jgi:hypothetical protein
MAMNKAVGWGILGYLGFFGGSYMREPVRTLTSASVGKIELLKNADGKVLAQGGHLKLSENGQDFENKIGIGAIDLGIMDISNNLADLDSNNMEEVLVIVPDEFLAGGLNGVSLMSVGEYKQKHEPQPEPDRDWCESVGHVAETIWDGVFDFHAGAYKRWTVGSGASNDPSHLTAPALTELSPEYTRVEKFKQNEEVITLDLSKALFVRIRNPGQLDPRYNSLHLSMSGRPVLR